MKKLLIFLIVITGIFPVKMFAYVGQSTPMLHVEGRYLKNPSGQNVLLHGWFGPTSSYFNGGCYSDPSDWTNTSNVAGLLNFLNGAADIMSNTSPLYGYNHGWYSTFVRLNTDAVGGWTSESGLVNSTQFDAWISNFIVPYANHLRTRGLYLVICATGPMVVSVDGDGTRNASSGTQQRLLTFWQRVANAPGVKNADNIHFELMNEPVAIETSMGNGNWGFGSSPYWSALRTWMQPVINTIRNTGANNIVWVPTLGWQGEPQGWAQYPFTGTNVAIAAHLYPGYGGCGDNATCVQNLWISNYKPAADIWPMIITEMGWDASDGGLGGGSTAIWGNTARSVIDNQGNVSFNIGFLDGNITLTNCLTNSTLKTSNDGAVAAFEWWYQYAGSGGCTPTSITPYIQVNGGTWQQTSSVTVASGATVIFGPQPVSGGSWSWSGCGTSGSSREQTIHPTGSCTATATYTNTGGCQSTQNFTVTVSGSSSSSSSSSSSGGVVSGGIYRITPRNGGKALDVSGCATTDGANVQNWSWLNNNCQKWQFTSLTGGYWRISPMNATSKALDVSGVSTADGANVHIWAYGGGNNQQWQLVSVTGGYYQIVARHSGKCLDLAGGVTTDGANIQQWNCSGSGTNGHFTLTKLNSAEDILTESLTGYMLYPSPVDNNLHITISGQEKVNVSIYNNLGALALSSDFTGDTKTLDVSKLTSGMYFIRLEGNERTITDRFIKK